MPHILHAASLLLGSEMATSCGPKWMLDALACVCADFCGVGSSNCDPGKARRRRRPVHAGDRLAYCCRTNLRVADGVSGGRGPRPFFAIQAVAHLSRALRTGDGHLLAGIFPGVAVGTCVSGCANRQAQSAADRVVCRIASWRDGELEGLVRCPCNDDRCAAE